MAKKTTKKTQKKPAKGKSPPVEPADNKAERKKKQREAIDRKVKKLTEFSTTTARQALALVEAYDEADEKSEELKPQISGLKGEIAKDKEEIRATAREIKAHGAKTEDQAKLGKKMAGLEQDVQRREIRLTDLSEARAGHRETMKAAMAELRKLIRDKAAGGLLFEKSDTAEDASSTTSASTATSPAGSSKPTAAAEPAPRPPSKSKPELKPTTVPVADKLSSIPLEGIQRSSALHPKSLEVLAAAGITTLGGYRELAASVADGKGKFPKGLLGSWVDQLDQAVKYYEQPHAVYAGIAPEPANAT